LGRKRRRQPVGIGKNCVACPDGHITGIISGAGHSYMELGINSHASAIFRFGNASNSHSGGTTIDAGAYTNFAGSTDWPLPFQVLTTSAFGTGDVTFNGAQRSIVSNFLANEVMGNDANLFVINQATNTTTIDLATATNATLFDIYVNGTNLGMAGIWTSPALLCGDAGFRTTRRGVGVRCCWDGALFGLIDEPDIAELDGVAVVLEAYGGGVFGFVVASEGCVDGCVGDFDIVMDENTIVVDGDAGVFGFCIAVEAWGAVGDVVGLPFEWGVGGVDLWW